MEEVRRESLWANDATLSGSVGELHNWAFAEGSDETECSQLSLYMLCGGVEMMRTVDGLGDVSCKGCSDHWPELVSYAERSELSLSEGVGVPRSVVP